MGKPLKKTTLEIPDALLIAAKKRAAEIRAPFRLLVEAALRSYLRQTKRPPRGKRQRKIRWKTVDGGLPAGLDLSNREQMHNWLRRSGR